MAIATETRNANLADLAQMLKEQAVAKHDVIVDANGIRSVNGVLHIAGAGYGSEIPGFTGETGTFLPTEIMDGHISVKLGIPVKYLRRMRADRIDLYDANLNGWLQGEGPTYTEDPVTGYIANQAAPDSRRFLVRTFKDPNGGVGIGRSLASDSFGLYDNLDMLTALLTGVQEVEATLGKAVRVTGCDLSERRMIVRMDCPDLGMQASELLAGYRSPFTDRPVFGPTAKVGDWVSAGIVATNSETGGSAWQIAPRIQVLACTNGMTITKDAMRAIHLGSKLDEGVVTWNADTQEKNIALITAKTRDAVSTFLTPGYLEEQIAKITEVAKTPVTDPAKTVEVVAKAMAYTEEQQAGILDHFIKGGQVTAGGILQAVTSYAQTEASGDTQYDLEAGALQAMEVAAKA